MMNGASVQPSECCSTDLDKRFDQEEESIKSKTLVLQLFSGLKIATLTSLSFFCFAPGTSLGFAIAMRLSSITDRESSTSVFSESSSFNVLNIAPISLRLWTSCENTTSKDKFPLDGSFNPS